MLMVISGIVLHAILEFLDNVLYVLVIFGYISLVVAYFQLQQEYIAMRTGGFAGIERTKQSATGGRKPISEILKESR